MINRSINDIKHSRDSFKFRSKIKNACLLIKIKIDYREYRAFKS